MDRLEEVAYAPGMKWVGSLDSTNEASMNLRYVAFFIVAATCLSIGWIGYQSQLSEPSGNPVEPGPNGLLHDPIEDDHALQHSFELAEKLAEARIGKNDPPRMGYCHAYWAAKKDILKKHFGIDWRPPSEMNPQARFD